MTVFFRQIFGFLLLVSCVAGATLSIAHAEGTAVPVNESAFVRAWNEAELETSSGVAATQQRSAMLTNNRVSRFRMTAESKRSLPANVRNLTLGEVAVCYWETRRNLSSFQHDGMTDDESRGLIEFIIKDDHSEQYLREVPVQELKNDALESLLAKKPMPEDLGVIMLAIIDDETQHPDWREYVLQHIVFYYQQRWPLAERPLTAVEQNQCEAFQRSLAHYLRRKDNGLAGTALIVLKELALEDPDFDRRIVIVGALRIASDESASLDSRITALAVLGDIAPQQVRRVALDILKADSLPTTLRLAAMGALENLAADDLEVQSQMMSLQRSYRKRDQHPVLQKRVIDLNKRQ